MQENNWTTIITPKSKWYALNFKEIWDYRDLVFIFVKRDVVSIYKQTILGPVWFLLGPLFTVFTYNFLFSEVAHLSTDGLPGPLFYLGGTTLWNYFNSCFNGAASTFSANAGIFGKVYFPRLVTPISLMLSNLLKLSFQLLTYLGFFLYYSTQENESFSMNGTIFFIPLYILILAMIAMGSGIIVSSFTSKYRDLSMVVGIGMTLLMYASPIMYPSASIPDIYKPYLSLNPISPLIEGFRYAFTSTGQFNFLNLTYSLFFALITLFVGIFIFNNTQRTFMDTV